jgi:predicted dehydrogenase
MKTTRRKFLRNTAALAMTTALSNSRVLGANEKINVGIIGFGLIGRIHTRSFKEQSDVQITALAETYKPRMEAGAQLIDNPTLQKYSDFRKLLDNKSIDAIVVATPDHWHCLMTMMACAAGKDVYCEKPLTLFVKEGRWMIDCAKKHKRIVQVGTQQRSGPHFQKARELIQNKALGDLVSVQMHYFRNVMPGFGNPPDSSPPPELDYDMWLGPAPKRPYNPNRAIYHFRWFWDYSGGQMTNLAAHSLDVVHWYLGVTGPTAVTSAGGRFSLRDNGETPDTQDALIEYPGFTAVWSHREASAGPKGTSGLAFFGPKGSLAVSRSGFTLTPDPKIPPEGAVPRFAGAHPVGGPRAPERTGPAELWTEPAEDRTGDTRAQFRLHVRDFLDCVKSRQEPVSDLETAHRVATVCHLANLSLRLGRKLRWDAGREEVIGDAEAGRWLARPYRAPWDRELKALGVG